MCTSWFAPPWAELSMTRHRAIEGYRSYSIGNGRLDHYERGLCLERISRFPNLDILLGVFQGRKKYTPPPWKPSFFSFSRVWGSIVYTLFSGPMVYTLFPCFPRKMVYTIAFFALWARGRATDREKRGATVVVYTLFSPVFMFPLDILSHMLS